jgi:hypothetical protein
MNEPTDRVRQLEERVEELGYRLAALEHRLNLVVEDGDRQHEVFNTRRLVIVDDAQEARCTIDGNKGELRFVSPRDRSGVLIDAGTGKRRGLPTVALLDGRGDIDVRLDRNSFVFVDEDAKCGPVERLRAELAAEVRTERLVVVTDDGFERLETTHGHDNDWFRMRIQCRDEKTAIEVLANEEMTAVDQIAGVYATASDECVVQFEASNMEGEGPLAGEGRLLIEKSTVPHDQIELTANGLRSVPKVTR